MTDQGIIIIGITLLLTFAIIYATPSKSKEQKAIEREQERIKIQQENMLKYAEERRLKNIAIKKEEERVRKLEEARKKQDELIRKSKIVVNNIGKVVSDGTYRLRKNIDKKISQHYLTSFSWLMVTSPEHFVLFTFKNNNELIITKNGDVEKATYEVLGQNQSILITRNDRIEHFNFINLSNDYFFLNKLSTYNVHAFVNQNKYKDDSRDWFFNETEKLKEVLKSNKP